MGSSSFGMTAVDRNSSGKVVSSPTDRVVSVLLVRRPTNNEMPDQAMPKAMASRSMITMPRTPVAMLTPTIKAKAMMMATWITMLTPSLRTLPSKMEDLRIGATFILSKYPLSRSLTIPMPDCNADDAIVWMMTAAVKNVM